MRNGKTTTFRNSLFILTFFLDFLQTLRKMSLMFQMNDLLVCSIPRYLEESLSTIEELHLVPGENFRKLFTKVTSENRGIDFQEITLHLSPQTRNKQQSTSQNLGDFYDHFVDIVNDTVDYIKDPLRK